jgi:hypothetical protein
MTKPVVGDQVGRSLGNQQTNYMSNNLQTQKVPRTMYEQRQRLGQCFKCGDKFMSGHKCIVKGLHTIEGHEKRNLWMLRQRTTLKKWLLITRLRNIAYL